MRYEYSVYASGRAILKTGINQLPEEVVDEMKQMFRIDSDVAYTEENNHIIFSFMYKDDYWDPEYVIEIMKSMLPYVAECSLDCCGADDVIWQIRLHNGEWIESPGIISYDIGCGDCDAAMLKRPANQSLSEKETSYLFELLTDADVCPLGISNQDGTSIAKGFITAKAAAKLDGKYAIGSDFGGFIVEILNDPKLETLDHIYRFNELKIKLDY